MRRWSPCGARYALQSRHLRRTNVNPPRIQLVMVSSLDTNSVHGATCALSALAGIFQRRGDEEMLAEVWPSRGVRNLAHGVCTQILSAVSIMRPTLFTAFGADMMLEGACNLIAATMCRTAANAEPHLLATKRIIDLAMKSRNSHVQDAVARAMGSASEYRDCTSELLR